VKKRVQKPLEKMEMEKKNCIRQKCVQSPLRIHFNFSDMQRNQNARSHIFFRDVTKKYIYFSGKNNNNLKPKVHQGLPFSIPLLASSNEQNRIK